MFKSFNQVDKYFNERQNIGIKPGLDRVFFLLQRVNHPEKEIHGIHVAGTNGKGSTIEMIQSVLVAHHYRVGVFTSPSFSGLTGHCMISGEEVTEKEFTFLVNELLPHIDALDKRGDAPTVFEILTVLAFMYFKGKTDIVLIETGMGGRYDTTNCFIPLISVITTVHYDHMQFLGSDLEDIASHKAGVMKEKRPLVLGNVSEEVRQVIDQERKALNVPIYEYGKQFSLYNDRITVPEINKVINIAGLRLQGHHQKENAAIVVMILALLEDNGFAIDWDCVEKYIEHTTLPGRFEVIHKEPTIILDSAHNIAGVEALKQTIISMNLRTKKQLLFAGFSDKQLQEMMNRLQPLFDSIWLTTFDHERAANEREYKEQQMAYPFINQWQEKVLQMIKDTSSTTYVITGSLHFITLVRNFILKQKNI